MNDASSPRLGADQTGPSDHLTGVRPTWSSNWWPLLAVGLIATAFCAPFIRYVWFLGDEGVLVHGAERMLRGERIYIDFFEFLPPGGFMIMEGWFGLAGISLFSARALAILTIVGIVCFTYLACRQASKNWQLSALIAVGWLIVSQEIGWIQINHHWFTTLFSMIAAWATLTSVEHARPWLRGPLIAGFAAGAAAMVTPTRGALAVLAAATAFLNLRRYRTELITYALGSALIPICVVAYMVGHNALRVALDDVIVFTATRYTSVNADVPFGLWARFHLRWIFPLGALFALVGVILDRRKCLDDRVFWTCVAFGFAGFIGCFPRPDVLHISFAAPLVCPLLANGVNRLTRRWPVRYWYAAAAIATASLIPYARGFSWTSKQALVGDVVPMPRGDITSSLHGMSELAARIAATPSGDAYFFYPYDSMLPFLTARQHVSRYDLFTPNYTLPSQYQEACISVMRDASWVVIDRKWTDPKVLINVFPGMHNPEPEETRRFEQALEGGFELVEREGMFELRRRVPGADETLCNGIAE